MEKKLSQQAQSAGEGLSARRRSAQENKTEGIWEQEADKTFMCSEAPSLVSIWLQKLQQLPLQSLLRLKNISGPREKCAVVSWQSLSQHGDREKAALVLWGLFSNSGEITYVTYVSSGDGGCGRELTTRFLFSQFILVVVEVLPKSDKSSFKTT